MDGAGLLPPLLDERKGFAMPDKSMSLKEIMAAVERLGQIFWQPVKYYGLAPGTTQKVTFVNQDKNPLMITQLIGYASDVVTGVKTFDYRFQFKDSATYRILMGDSIHGSAIGTGEFPTTFSVPYLIRGSASFEIDLYSLHAVNNINIDLVFFGFKLYG